MSSSTEQDACGDKLLADGADFVDGFRSGRNIEFNIRQAVPFGLDNLPVLYDSDGDAGNMLPLHLGFHVVVNIICARGARCDEQ